MKPWHVELPSGGFRESTQEEQKKGEALKQELDAINAVIETAIKKRTELLDQCDHKLFVDIAGWPYNIRKCAVCGHGLGMV